MLRTLMFISLCSLAFLLPSVGRVQHEPRYAKLNLTTSKSLPQSNLADSPRLELSNYPLAPPGTYSNDYAFGNCTALAASMVQVPNSMGNANQWDDKASLVSSTPVVGMIAQTDEGWAGHVAVVVAVGDGTVTVMEANYNGFNVIDERTTNVSDWVYLYF